MIGENQWVYLDSDDYARIHALLAAWSTDQGEPIPPFSLAKQGDIDALVQIPKGQFFGYSAYPTLAEKAAIIFYTINKRQLFLNGNKRMSTLSLIVFLKVNHMVLDVPPDELTQKALWLANTASDDFLVIKDELAHWIQDHLRAEEDPKAM